jgi:hypothetical protein
MALLRFSPDEFLQLGLQLAGFKPSRVESTGPSTNGDRFKDAYYACPTSVNDIFLAIQSPALGERRISNPCPHDLLLAFFFLKKYSTKYSLAAFIDTMP